MIGCCNSFKECSDLGECVHKENNPLYGEIYKDCCYYENLKKGLNFYTKYNDNNRRRKEEYEKSLLNKPSKTGGTNVLPAEKEKVPVNAEIKEIEILDKFLNHSKKEPKPILLNYDKNGQASLL